MSRAFMRLKQPCAVVVTKGGRRLIRDRQYGQAILQKANGSFVGLAGAVGLDMRGANDVVMDSKGRILSTKGAGGAGGKDAPQGFVIQNCGLERGCSAYCPHRAVSRSISRTRWALP